MSSEMFEQGTHPNHDVAKTTSSRLTNLKITLISLHGLIRADNAELGRDADTGGQVLYVLELARELAEQPEVREVELLTRQIVDPKVDDDYAQLEEPISEHAKIVRIPFGPRRYLRKEALWPYIEMFIDQTLTHFKRIWSARCDSRSLRRRGIRRCTARPPPAHPVRLHRTLARTC